VSTGEQQSEHRKLARKPLAQAFLVSLLLHFTLIGTVELGRVLGFWDARVLPRWNQQQKIAQELNQGSVSKQEQEIEIPLVFVEVDPSQAVEEPPPETQYYSSANTRAANPVPRNEPVPRIEGSQDKVPRVIEVRRPEPEQMQPEPPKPEPPRPQPPAEQLKPQPVEAPKPEPVPEPSAPEREPAREPQPNDGDIQIARAPSPEASEPPRAKPRTLAEARRQKGLIPAEPMKQEGGVRRQALEPGLDVKSSPFGSYDAAFIAAVQTRWFNLLDERDFIRGQAGKVVLEFRLNKDGRITDLRVVESEVSDMLSWLCQRAVLDPAPFRPFPPDLLREMQQRTRKDYRDIQFTFHYLN
jgi:outer membrane biosynthesis protein TonB